MPTTVLPHRGLVQEVLWEKCRKNYLLESGDVSSSDVQTVIDTLDAMPDFAGAHARVCMATRESRAYLVQLKTAKVAAGR